MIRSTQTSGPLTWATVESLRRAGSWETALIAERYLRRRERYARASRLGKLWLWLIGETA